MAKAKRLERLDIRRAELQAHYREALVAALQRTMAGNWGLFGHNKDRRMEEKVAPVIDNLTELSSEIDGMRDQLGLEPFELHRAFMASRGPVASNAVGEPKQARAWLERLDEAEPGNGG